MPPCDMEYARDEKEIFSFHPQFNLKQLKCILCESDLKVTDEVEVSVSEVKWANLECISCKNKYPVVLGIPILMPSEAYVSVKKHKIEDNLVKKDRPKSIHKYKHT